MSVERYSIEPPTAVGAPYEHGDWVRFTDHEAALAAFARHEGCDEAGRCEGYDEGRRDALIRTRATVAADGPDPCVLLCGQCLICAEWRGYWNALAAIDRLIEAQ